MLDGNEKEVERKLVMTAADQLTISPASALAELPYLGCLVKTADDRQRLGAK
jgi:hypothetical protein